MATSQYSPPVDQLLTYGNALEQGGDWSEYLNLGITTAHVPALIQMLEDEALFLSESEDEDYWAVVHAWRTVGALKAEAAIPALIAALGRWGDDDPWWDWVNEEFPDVFQAIGTVTIPALVGFIADCLAIRFSAWHRGSIAAGHCGTLSRKPFAMHRRHHPTIASFHRQHLRAKRLFD
jgi:hypothetical protein